MDRVKEYQSRVKRFISRQPLEWQLDDYPEWMLDRWTFYTDRECAGDRESIAKKIIRGGICHHHDSRRVHYLCKFGNYDEVCVLGADGEEYAEGKVSLGPPVIDLSEWATISRRVGDICSKVYNKRLGLFMKAIIPAKYSSIRVPKKNWIDFDGDKCLVTVLIEKLVAAGFAPSDIYVSSESRYLMRRMITLHGVNGYATQVPV